MLSNDKRAFKKNIFNASQEKFTLVVRETASLGVMGAQLRAP